MANYETTAGDLAARIPAAGLATFGSPQDHLRTPPRFEVKTPADNLSMWGFFSRAVTDKYAEFDGRARRKEFWSFILFYSVFFALVFIAGIVIDVSVGRGPIVTWAFLTIYGLGMFIPYLAVLVRRFHDTGMSGWLAPAGLVIPLFSLIVSLLPSEITANKYGLCPK